MMINAENLKNVIAQGESQEVLFVEDCDHMEIGKSICGLLNTTGGTIIIGITSKRNILGVEEAKKKKKLLHEFLVNNIVPEAPFTIDIEDFIIDIENFKKKKLLLIKTGKGGRLPHIFKGDIFYRDELLTRKASSQELSKLIHSRKISEQSWERQLSLGVDISSLDLKLISKILKTSRKKKLSGFEKDDELSFLQHYGLYSNGHFTNAAVLLFAYNPSRFIPQIRVRLIEYATNKSDANLIRNEVLEGNLFELRDHFEDYFNSLGNKAVFEKNQWKRTDFHFPPKALQEGVINALIHRDYSSATSCIEVSVYPDKIVIYNSGHLPYGLEIKDLKKSHKSYPQNPDIAHIFFLGGYIDKLGKGTVKVVQECRNEGLMDPRWKKLKDGIELTFYGPKALASRKPIQESLNKNLKESILNLFGSSFTSKSQIVSNRLVTILSYIYVFPEAKAVELQEFFGVSERTILSDLKKLNKYLIYIGSKKYGGYNLKDTFRIMINQEYKSK